MNWFNSLFTPTGTLPIQRREVQQPIGVPQTTDPNHQSNQPSVDGGSFEERIAYVRGPEQALLVAAVYHAINLRADTMSVMPVQYQKKDYEGGNFITDMRGLGKRMNYLLQEQPNPIMSAVDMWKLVEINRLFYGNAFVYIERDEFGFPAQLWLVRTGGYNIVTGTYSSLVFLTDHGYETLVNVPREDVLHFANTFRYQNGIWGIPTLQYAVETLSLNRTLRQQALETAAKGGRVKGFLGEDTSKTVSPIAAGLFDKKEMDKYAEEIQNKIYRGHDIIAIRALDKFVPISMTGSDMQAFEQLGATNDDVSRFFGVPRPLLMLDTNSHYNDYQNATMEFHTRTILPQKTGNEKEIARKLIGFKDYGVRRIHICEKPLLAMDPERQAKVDQLNLQTGAKTVNEIRAEHDMPSVEKGDIVYISTNVAELGSTKLSGESSTELKPGNYTVKEPQNNNNNGEESK